MKHLNHQPNNYLIPLAIVGLLFFLLGFSLGMNGLLIPFLKKAFSLSHTKSYLVLTATYLAFVAFSYPFGALIKKTGYRRGIVLAFIFFSVGLYLFVPSANWESFPLFLLASFICGSGNTLMQAVINPYVTILGPIEAAGKRLCFLNICNRIGWIVAPVFLAIFIDITQINVQLSDLFLPFYIIVGIFIVLGICTWFSPLPEITAVGEDEKDISTESSKVIEFVETKKSVFQFPHLIIGVIATFFSVGIETLLYITPVDFADTIGLPNPERYMIYPVAATILGCLLGFLLTPRYISQLTGLRIGVVTGTFFCLLIPILPAYLVIYAITIASLAFSLNWPVVWPLAISYLGKYTKIGSALLVSSIVGAAILPIVFGYLKDLTGDIQKAYWLFFPSMLLIVFYAFYGYKIGLKGIIKN
jgi:fucose permease